MSQLNFSTGLKAIAVPGSLGAPCAGTLSSSWTADSTLLLSSVLVPVLAYGSVHWIVSSSSLIG